MPLFAVSLLSESRLAGAIVSNPKRELAIHVVCARDESEARARGAELGVKRQHSYHNAEGIEVSWVFQRVVECQDLDADLLTDGLEVSSWLYEGERLSLNDGWSTPPA